jgi:hypothetical protein
MIDQMHVSIPLTFTETVSPSRDVRATAAVNPTSHADDPTDDTLHVVVIGIDGVARAIDLSLADTILDVKQKMADYTGIPSRAIWLSSNGHFLYDGWPVCQCWRREHGFIHVHLRITDF